MNGVIATYDPQRIRAAFPSLQATDNGKARIFLDNPGGTQIAGRATDRMVDYLQHMNANGGGAFVTSLSSDDLLEQAHAAMADFLGAESPSEIVFGQNMTTLTFHISRSIGRMLDPGDEIVLTRMDHDANISPWLMLAEDRGLTVRWIDFDPHTWKYDPASMDKAITRRTKLVACSLASNAIGTVNDVRTISRLAHEAGALVYVDAVQYAPHFLVDVQALECDFLVCSAYKFYGPHQGILWGRRSVLQSLTPYKVRPCSDDLPFRFETGTLSHEGIAGTLGTVEHWEWIGRETGPSAPSRETLSRRDALRRAFDLVAEYERNLCVRLLEGLQSVPGLQIHGLTDRAEMANRVPTVAITMEAHRPRALAERLAGHNVFVWDGHYYAVEVVRRLGLEEAGGMLRIGLGQYNTAAEVDRMLDVLAG